MKNRVCLPLSLLLCGILTACAGKPELPPPVGLAAAVETAVITPYVPEDLGGQELFYDEHWKFYLRDAGQAGGVSSLICHELDTGSEWVLDELDYGSGHSYWEKVRLYPFTGILGCSGFVFEHPAGAAYEAYDFYAVTDTGASLIAPCSNAVYTADLDGDGQRELLSNYHLMGYLDLFWTAGENHIVCSCSLNETARDYLGLIPGELVSLYIQEDSGAIDAQWTAAPDGSSRSQRKLDLTSLWKWEKARTEFWDVLPLYTDGGRSISIRLRESRSRPEEYPLFDKHYRVEEIQVYDGNTLIQTILPDDLSYNGDYLFDGLYVVHGPERVPGIPDIRDFNFDGCSDLGLMTSDSFSHNVSYCYFLWDPEAGQLSTDFFVLFAPLEVDGENRRLIEPVSGSEPSRCYHFDGTNHPVLTEPT